MQVDVKIPQIFVRLFNNDKRYTVLHGGRGSGKSHAVATFLIVKALEQPKRILCTREIQQSLADSVKKLLEDKISDLGLTAFFEVQHDKIIGVNGSLIIFKGLARNAQEIKSTEGLDYVWVEEAQNVSRHSLEILTPTVRKENSQILYTMNPTDAGDPVYVDYVLADRDDTLKIKANYSDNRYFPDVLVNEMEYCRRVDYDKYLHIWEGQCVAHSEAQVFYGKWVVDEVVAPENTFFYFGADWGFSKDPTALVRCFVKDNKLFIDREAYGVGIDTDKLPALFDTVEGVRNYPIIADSARPETISYLRQRGFNIQGARKGKGSVEDGVSFIRSFEQIVIDHRCKHTIDEFRLYQYKTDKKTGLISTVLEDGNNHVVDALRYGLEPLMTKNKGATINVIGW